MSRSRGVLAIVREDLEQHGGRVNHPGFVALLVYRFGRWRGQLADGPTRKLLRWPYVLLHRRVRNRHRIELHFTTELGRRVHLSGRGDIVIGNRAVIGDGSRVGYGVTIGKTRADAPGWPVIGREVTIGPGVAVIGDLTVGDGAVLGPNSVVLADVPAGAEVVARAAVVEPAPEAVRPSSTQAAPPARLPVRGAPIGGRNAIADSARVGRRLRIRRDARVLIDDGVWLGDDCTIGYGVTIGWRAQRGDGPAPVTRIGDRIVLGDGVVVIAGVTIGDGASIAPNVVVSADVPRGARVACPPAGILRSLRPAIP